MAAPNITSDGGRNTAFLTVREGFEGDLTTLTATGGDIHFSASGGDDSDLFEVLEVDGTVAFSSPPEYGSPLDADGDNVYELIVRATNDDGYDEQAISVRVMSEASLWPPADWPQATWPPKTWPASDSYGVPAG